MSPQWLEAVYATLAKGEIDDAIDLLFDLIDDMLLDGRFSACDEVLRAIDLTRLDTNLMVAALSITKDAAPKLSQRPAFVERVRRRVIQLAPDRLDELLSGLC